LIVYDRLFFVELRRAANIKHTLSLDTPQTLPCWHRTLRRGLWTVDHRPAKGGRKPAYTEVKNVVLSMTNNSVLWVARRSRANR
jgi:hypothetical protein